MDAQCDEPTGGSKRRRGAGASSAAPHSSSHSQESGPPTKKSRKHNRKTRTSRRETSTPSTATAVADHQKTDTHHPHYNPHHHHLHHRQDTSSSNTTKVLNISLSPTAVAEDLAVLSRDASADDTSVSSTTANTAATAASAAATTVTVPSGASSCDKGTVKNNRTLRSLRPRKVQSYLEHSSFDEAEFQSDGAVGEVQKSKARKSRKGKKKRHQSSEKKNKKDKAPAPSPPKPHSKFELDNLQLYSDSEDLVEELEEFISSTKPLSPRKRLRSSSNEEKVPSPVFNSCVEAGTPGPSSLSSVSKPEPQSLSSSKKAEDNRKGSSASKKRKNSKSPSTQEDNSKRLKEKDLSASLSSTSGGGKTRNRKTGSCASSSGRHSSAGSRGSGRAGTSRGSSVAARERADGKGGGGRGVQHHNTVTTSSGISMSSSGNNNPQQQQQQQQMSDPTGGPAGGGGGGVGSGARPRDGAGPMTQAADGQGSSVLLGAVGGTGPDNESDDSDMNRLQALLEARGLPSHLFGALGPRMHQLLHRTMSGGTLTKVQHLLQSLQATGDEAQQLSALMEMCQILVMGNEDSLVGFPIKLVVPALIQLLQMEHNFEMMIHASRALTYMMEALPRSSACVIEGVAVFLEKLQVINCIDVAEQSLSALETLSKRHGKTVLQAGGISACLMFLDFFSIIAQRRALNITANCVQSMSSDEFHYMRDSLSLLSGRLSHSDSKSVESVCLCFARLVDNFQSDQRLLKEIAVHDLLTNIQQLLMMSPPVINTGVFITVIRMLAVMCSNCPDLAVILLKQKIAETLRYLLTGSSESSDGCFELVSRTPQELYEIVSLIGELLPRLPMDGIFQVNSLLRKGGGVCQDCAFWQWQDDRGLWHMYAPIDNKIVEAAYQAGEEEVNLSTMGRSYVLDLNSMQQINEDTGTARPVVRKTNSLVAGGGVVVGPGGNACSNNAASQGQGQIPDPNVEQCDSRAEILKEDKELASTFIQTLFAVLYEVYSSSAGPNIRHKCLQTILRMIYYAGPDLLRQVLVNQPVSSHIAGMLGSPDLKVVVGAVQMANILMQKLPEVFSIYFRREGVTHQVQRLASQEITCDSPTKSSSSTTASPNPSPSTVAALMMTSSSSTANTTTTNNLTPAATMISSTTTTNPNAEHAHHHHQHQHPHHPTHHHHHPPPPPPAPHHHHHTTTLSTTTAVSTVGGGGIAPPSSTIATRSLSRSEVFSTTTTTATPDSLEGGEGHGGHSHGQTGGIFTPGVVSPQMEEPCASSAHMKLSDVLKRKRPPRRGPSKKGSKSDDLSTVPEPTSKGMGLLLGRSSTRGKGASSSKESRSSSSGSKIPFLTNLNPRSWGRMGGSSERQATMKEMLSHKHLPPPMVVNKEKVREWIKTQCNIFMEKYFSADINGGSHPALDLLKRLCAAAKCLSTQGDSGIDCLLEISNIVTDSDISPFEVIHSGLISKLLEYLTTVHGDVDRDIRIRRFLHVFLNLPPPSVTYLKEPLGSQNKPSALSCLTSKLLACLHQLEQFQVKIHDLPGGGGANSGSRGGNALKFFTTHQLKCQLQRHPSCNVVKQWKGGPVKIDPLALVQAIEKYLLVRGYGKMKEGVDEELSDEDNSDEEMEEQMASIMISSTSPRHRLEFLIGEQVLPYNMTVYQAVKQYVCHGGTEVGDFADTDGDSPFGNTSLWVQTHTIWYRPATEREETSSCSPKKTKAESKSSKSSKKKDSRATSPVPQPILHNFLTDKLPASVTVQDSSLETIALLRVLSALNRHWASLYDISFVPSPILPQYEFLSSKLTAKTNRQLQDPLIIMTGNLPSWLPEIGQAAPFLLPFDTRQMLFFATTFDRDRAVLRLQQDQAGESSSHDSERVGPRLDRKRREVSRKDILKQAEKVIEDMSSSTSARTMLEIHYENEVGTGLGPTLEFYALVSKELQRTDLELWRGDSISATSLSDPNLKTSYTQSPCGLFPAPLHRGCKAAQVNKVKAKFKFLGKFMAKALMDSRMIDLPLSQVFYKWMLGMESSLTSSDLYQVDRVLARSFQQLENISHKKKQIITDKSLTEEGKRQAISRLTLDGCSLEDLDLYFNLPGYPNIELCKGGADIQVTQHNLDEYLQLVIHWTLVEGVSRQFEAFRDGFETLFPLSTLQCFYPDELDQLFCGNQLETWDTRMLTDCCRPDHGYNHDSQAVKFLFEVLSSYGVQEQRDFLQFVTGSPRLPVGGFRSLNPPLTIVRKQPEGSDKPDHYLPSVMTCVNYLKLPDYSSAEVMRAKLAMAAKEGQLSFHLS